MSTGVWKYDQAPFADHKQSHHFKLCSGPQGPCKDVNSKLLGHMEFPSVAPTWRVPGQQVLSQMATSYLRKQVLSRKQ